MRYTRRRGTEATERRADARADEHVTRRGAFGVRDVAEQAADHAAPYGASPHRADLSFVPLQLVERARQVNARCEARTDPDGNRAACWLLLVEARADGRSEESDVQRTVDARRQPARALRRFG